MIRAIIFDCFGVLYSGSIEYLRSLAPAERARDVVDLNQQKDYGFLTYTEYLEQTAEAIGISPSDIERIMHERHVRNAALVDYVRELKGQYKVGLLSNVGENIFDTLFTPQEVSELFDEVLLSYKEGLAKPNPAIFTVMAERLGVGAGECVMIDDLASNCEGAEVAGMQAVQFVTNDLLRDKMARLLQRNT